MESSDLPLRILVQSDMIGAIIGRSGGTIKTITQQSRARIDVHREDCLDQTDKVITINGVPESCSAACAQIMRIIENEKALLSMKNGQQNNRNDNDNGDTRINDQAKPLNHENNETTLRILAHNNLIGRLIGRNGASIKKIMDMTSTRINISVNKLTDSTHERTIIIFGSFDQVRQAEEIVSSKLRAAYASDVNFTFQAINQNAYPYNNVPISYVPRPYARGSILNNLVNSQVGTHAGQANRHAISRNLPPICSHPPSQIQPPLYHNQSNYLHLYPGVGGISPGPGVLGFIPTMETDKETAHIYIPAGTVGAIIGKSGSAIKEMIVNSGATIKIAAAAPTPVESNARSSSNTTSNSEPVASSIEGKNSQQESFDPSQNSESNQQDPTDDIQRKVDNPHHKGKSDKIESFGISNDATNSSANAKEASIPDFSQVPPTSSNPSQNTRRNITASDTNSQNRKVTIVGTPDSQWTAQYLIFRKVSNELGLNDVCLMVEIQIPSQLVGKIIGKGGLAVKQLQKQTRTTIRLYDNKPASEEDFETTVQITGEFQNCHMAQRHIRCLIKESLFASSRNNAKGQARQTEANNPVGSNSQQVDFGDSNDQYHGYKGIGLNDCDTQDQSRRLNEKNFHHPNCESDNKLSEDTAASTILTSKSLGDDSTQPARQHIEERVQARER